MGDRVTGTRGEVMTRHRLYAGAHTDRCSTLAYEGGLLETITTTNDSMHRYCSIQITQKVDSTLKVRLMVKGEDTKNRRQRPGTLPQRRC